MHRLQQREDIEQELAEHRLKIVWTQFSAECIGIGRGAVGQGRISVPAGIAGVNGLIRFNVVKDSPALFANIGSEQQIADDERTTLQVILKYGRARLCPALDTTRQEPD